MSSNNMQNYEELVSNAAISELDQELKLSYSKLHSFNAFSKAGDKFDSGDWGFYISIFALGYLNNFINNRLDDNEKDLHQVIYQAAQSKFISNIFGEANSSLILSKCWDAINNDGEAELFFNSGAAASEDKNGARKHLITAFVMKYRLLA